MVEIRESDETIINRKYKELNQLLLHSDFMLKGSSITGRTLTDEDGFKLGELFITWNYDKIIIDEVHGGCMKELVYVATIIESKTNYKVIIEV